MTQFRVAKFMESKPKARIHNDSGIMEGAKVALSDKKYSFADTDFGPWSETLEITDKLPANTWLRVEASLNSHYWDPVSADAKQKDRLTDGLVGRLMYRNTNPKDALNLLFVVAPGIIGHSGSADAWTTIDVDPTGRKLTSPLKTCAPKDRDWWRPEPATLPYLKQSFQKYVQNVNDAAATQARAKYGTAGRSLNFVQKIAFQLGNEPGTGHPGGSWYANIGSWEGLGRVTEGYSVGVNYGVSPSVRTALGIPTSFGSNPLTLPAFSFLNENANGILGNYVSGKLKNFQTSGSTSPGVTEIATYGKEMNDFKWAQQCGRRSVHFRSPVLRWRFRSNDYGEAPTKSRDLLFYGPGDPRYGAWETPQEYARRWVEELERTVDLVAGLPMPTASRIVDVTECYFVASDLGAASMDVNMVDASGAKISFVGKTLDQVREMGRNNRLQNGKFSPLAAAQQPPSRQQILVAIREELYRRDIVEKNLSKNLGRIFLWSAIGLECRAQTGLGTAANGDVNSYAPWNDFRLSTDELRAFWNLQ